MRKYWWLRGESLINVLTPTIRRDSLEIILGSDPLGGLLTKGSLVYT